MNESSTGYKVEKYASNLIYFKVISKHLISLNKKSGKQNLLKGIE